MPWKRRPARPGTTALRDIRDINDPMNTTTSYSGVEVRQAAAAFARPIAGRAWLQLLTSFGPFIAGCVAMYTFLPIFYPLALALVLR